MDNIPFPQADNFDRIVKILDVNDEKNLSDFEFMCAFLDGITDRQVSYYLSAAMYLGILDREKHYTAIGIEIKKMDHYSRISELIRLLISDKIIGKIYVSQKVLGLTYNKDDIAEIIKQGYPEYSEPIYKRRAQTVQSWLDWIDSQMNK